MIPLAEVLRRHWPEYQRAFAQQILPSHRRAVQCILECRTRALGGEMYRCQNCRRDHFVYHSCNHRACPQCGHAHASQWIAKQKLKLLPVPYYLITFTVPEGLRGWLRSHQKLGYASLLRESASALQDVADRPKYLGAEIGCLSVLHTWGRQLQYHPHVHCVVPAGGLREDGLRWCRAPASDFFLPQRVLAARFRNRLKQSLAQAQALQQIPASVWRQPWVVDVQPAGSGEAALKYLSAYVTHTALGHQRILRDEQGRITFKYSCPKRFSVCVTMAGWRRRPGTSLNASWLCWIGKLPGWCCRPSLNRSVLIAAGNSVGSPRSNRHESRDVELACRPKGLRPKKFSASGHGAVLSGAGKGRGFGGQTA